MRKLTSVATLCVILLTAGCIEKVQTGEELTGDYLGQKPPTEATLFAPGIVSTGFSERDFAITPDGNEIFYTLMWGNQGVILRVVREDGMWGEPEVAPFSGKYSDLEPFISPDGSKLYFVSTRPLEGTEEKDCDIWICDRIDDEWGEPYNIGEPVSTDKNEFFPSVTNSGTLYFTAVYDGRENRDDLYRAEFKNGAYEKPVLLPEEINTLNYEYNQFIAPDESYLIYSAYGREGEQGRGDMYINFRDTEGNWSKAINLGDAVNSPLHEYCPYVTRDGKYLFFTSARTTVSLDSLPEVTYDNLRRALNAPGNGSQDVYWIDASFIKSLAIE
ncbi:MAG: hypothetical protein R3F48_06415 [Candidatus Zixiibacteriota bacterium]